MVTVLVAVAVGAIWWIVANQDDDDAGANPYWDGPTGVSEEQADGEGPDPKTISVRGHVEVPAAPGNTESVFSPCKPKARYAEITNGVAVRLVGDDDELIGKGALNSGRLDAGTGMCVFEVDIANVPASAEGYWVQVGNYERFTEHHPDGVDDEGPHSFPGSEPVNFQVAIG